MTYAKGEIEADWIQQIVDQISSRFRWTSLSYLQNIVGISTHLEKVKSLLEIEIDDVRIVGIWGMGGVGKTTIARTVFDTLSDQYKAVSFLADVKENKCGMHVLQNILLSELLGERDNCVNNKEDGKHLMSERLRFKKVLVVLDDIDHIDQLDYLAGGLDWFGSGSRIILTTRDRHLIGKNGVYEVATLVKHEALQLFNQHAFKEEHPDDSFKDLALEVVSHAKGLPLALKVWGSFLYNRDITEWRSAIADMKTNSNSEIVDKLKISYNRLEPTLQKMFLDLACFLRGKKRGWIKEILESCDFKVDIGLRILIDRSLVFISHKEDTIEMHDLIQEMGKSVVNMQGEPGERSRLWHKEDIKEVLKNNMGTTAVEAIWLPSWNADVCFSNGALINMRSLRIFGMMTFGGGRTQDGSIMCLPNKLRWFVWKYYPWESLPETFEQEKLVHLELTYNNLHFLWTGMKHLRYLRTLNLEASWSLKRTPDFTGMPNLEYLLLSGCSDLEEVSPSLGCCRKLIQLDLSFCSNLESLPEEIGNLENLEKLDALETAISQPPSSIVRLNNLKFLDFQTTYSTLHFVFPLVGEGLRSLEYLELSLCDIIDGGLPEDIGCLSSLKGLYLWGNDFENLPRSIAQLGALQVLNLGKCKRLKNLPELPPELEELRATSNVILKDIHSLVTKKKLLNLMIDDVYIDYDSIFNSFACALHQNFSSKQQDIFASDYLSQRVFGINRYTSSCKPRRKIPSWFHYQGKDTSVSVDLPKNWYAHENFLGFAICYDGRSVETTVHLKPLCDDDEMSWMTQKLALHNYSKHYTDTWDHVFHFFLVPLAGLWDISKANRKTPNDYGHIQLYFSGEMKEYGLRLLYKDELEENSDQLTELCIGIRRSRYDNNGEASCSNFKKQRGHSNIHRSSVVENLLHRVKGPVYPETLQLFPANPGF